MFTTTCFSQSCGIELGEFFIITGGTGTQGHSYRPDVTKYSRAGYVNQLPRLNEARRSHACGKYRDVGGREVLLVTGGNGFDGPLRSTEMYEDQGFAWTLVESASLPWARFGLAGVTYNNRLFLLGTEFSNYFTVITGFIISGGTNKNGQPTSSILEFIPFNKTIVEVSSMTMPRYYHAVSLIENVDQFCPTCIGNCCHTCDIMTLRHHDFITLGNHDIMIS